MIISKQQLTILLLLFLCACVLGVDINSKWKTDHDGSSGAHYSIIAKNYLRYGYAATKLGCVINGGIVKSDEFSYYLSQPPLFPIVLSVAFKLFGISEGSARLTSVIFSLAFVFIFFKFAQSFFNWNTAVLASIFAILSPVFLSFGNYASQESLALFLIVSFFFNYYLWCLSGAKVNLYLMFICYFLAMLTGWFGYFLVIPVAVQLFFSKSPTKKRILLIQLLIFALLTFALHLAHIYVLMGTDGFNSLFERFTTRSGITSNKKSPTEGYGILFLMEIYRGLYLFTPLMFCFATFWTFEVTRKIRTSSVSNPDVIILGFLFLGISPIPLFRNLFFNHNFYLIYLLPFTALSSAVVIDKWMERKKNEGFSKTEWKKRYLAVFIPFIAFSLPVAYMLLKWDTDPRPSFRQNNWIYESAEFVAKNTNPEDKIISNLPWMSSIDYYSDRFFVNWIESKKALEDTLNNKKMKNSFFLLYINAPYDEELIKYLKSYYTVTAQDKNGFVLLKQK